VASDGCRLEGEPYALGCKVKAQIPEDGRMSWLWIGVAYVLGASSVLFVMALLHAGSIGQRPDEELERKEMKAMKKRRQTKKAVRSPLRAKTASVQ
jgi:hypothetical protein